MLVNTYSMLLVLLARAYPQFPMSVGARAYLQLNVTPPLLHPGQLKNTMGPLRSAGAQQYDPT